MTDGSLIFLQFISLTIVNLSVEMM